MSQEQPQIAFEEQADDVKTDLHAPAIPCPDRTHPGLVRLVTLYGITLIYQNLVDENVLRGISVPEPHSE